MDRSLAKTEEDRHARVVPLEQAAWWNDGRLLERDARFDPAHIGEIVIVRPFARKTFSPPLCEALLRYIDSSARHRAGGVLQRWYLRRLLWWTSRVEIELQGVPDDDASHNALVRELRPYFGASTTLGGTPLRVRHPRGLADLRIIHVGQLAAIFAAGALPLALSPASGSPACADRAGSDTRLLAGVLVPKIPVRLRGEPARIVWSDRRSTWSYSRICCGCAGSPRRRVRNATWPTSWLNVSRRSPWLHRRAATGTPWSRR